MTQHPLPIPGPLSLGDIIDRAFRLYRAHFGRLIGALALVLGPWAILLVVLGSVVAATGSRGLSLLLSLVNLADSFVTGLAGLAVYFIVIAVLKGDRMAAGEAWRRALGRFWSWFGMTLLMGIAVGAAAIPGAIIFGLGSAVAYDFDGGGLGGVAALLIGLVIMFLPLMYLAARWIISEAALVAEDCGASASLGRSWRLSRGRIWRCLGFAVLIGLLGILIMFWPIALEYGVVLGLFGGYGATSWLSSGLVPLLTKALTILWTPLQVAAYVFFYYDLRVRTEGYDLAQRVEQLSAAARPDEAGQEGAEYTPDEEPVP